MIKNLSHKNKTIIAIVAVLTLGITITLALLSTQTTPSMNNFQGGEAKEHKVNIGIVENNDEDNIQEDSNEFIEFDGRDGTYAKKVQIKNLTSEEYPTKDTYVRVRFVVNCVDDRGNTLYPSTGIKVTGNMNATSAKWKYDETSKTFYYTEALKPGELTEELLQSVTVEGNTENYTIQVDVLTDAIEANEENLNKIWHITNGFENASFLGLAEAYQLLPTVTE